MLQPKHAQTLSNSTWVILDAYGVMMCQYDSIIFNNIQYVSCHHASPCPCKSRGGVRAKPSSSSMASSPLEARCGSEHCIEPPWGAGILIILAQALLVQLGRPCNKLQGRRVPPLTAGSEPTVGAQASTMNLHFHHVSTTLAYTRSATSSTTINPEKLKCSII